MPPKSLASIRRADVLIEREAELRALADRFGEIGESGGRIVLLSGEAGTGKTSLLRTFAGGLRDARIWWGACDALETPHPLGPLYDIVRTGDAAFGPHLRADADRATLFNHILGELQNGTRPALFVLEDAHWADEATLDFLRFLGRRIESAPCLLAITYRDDEVTASHPLRRAIGDFARGTVTRIDVPRLSASAVEALARRALRSSEGLFEATGGNAFFVTELLRSASAATPATIRDLVLSRYARLSPEARAIVDLVSAAPRYMERTLLDVMLPGEVLAPLEECLNRGLLEADGSTLQFRHELARSVVEGALSAPAARALHARVLRALLVDNEGEETLARIVHHAIRAHDSAAIVRFAPRAAAQAAARGANREAVMHYRAALQSEGSRQHPGRIDWLEGYARACQFTGRSDESLQAREEAVRCAREADDAPREARNLSELAIALVRAWRRGGLDANAAAIALLEAQPESVELAYAYRMHAGIYMLNRELDDAVEWAQKSLAIAERFNARDIVASALGTYGAAILYSDYERGRETLERAFAVSREIGADFTAASTLNNLGSGSCDVFRFPEARASLVRVCEFARERDIESAHAYASSYLALCEMFTGNWDEATRIAETLIVTTATRDLADKPVGRFQALIALARVRARRGEEGVQALLDEAIRDAQSIDSLNSGGMAFAARADAAHIAGDVAATIREANAILALPYRQGDEWLISELHYLLHAAGAPDPRLADTPIAKPYALQIAGRVREAAAEWDRLGCPFEAARALAEGDAAATLEALERFERLGAEPAIAQLRRKLRSGDVRGVPRRGRNARGDTNELTAREGEVVALLCEGLKNADIAERLFLSVRTVEHHVAAAFSKLGVSTRSEAVVAAMRAGLARQR